MTETLRNARIYDDPRWQVTRKIVIERDGGKCTVGWLLGDPCSGPIAVHHLRPLSEGGEPFNPDTCGSVCSHHHPSFEALRRAVKNYKTRVMPRPVRRPSPPSRLSWEDSLARELRIEERLRSEYGVLV